MNTGFFLAPVAVKDLEEIWDYYALTLQNVATADVILGEIFDAMEKLVQMPGMGHLRTDLAEEPVRFWRVRDFLIVYRAEKSPLEIARVLHGARDVRAILDPD